MTGTESEAARRVGRRFHHRDSRLEEGHPIVIASRDVTELCRLAGQQVFLDYGWGGGRSKYVEIAIYKPGPHTHWTHHAIDLERLAQSALPPEFPRIAEALGLRQEVLCLTLLRHVPNEMIRN